MRTLFEKLTLKELQQLFRQEEDKLATRLLSGVDWENTLKERQLLTELAIVIHEKVFPDVSFDYTAFKYFVKEEQDNDKQSATAFSQKNSSNTKKASLIYLPLSLSKPGFTAVKALIGFATFLFMGLISITHSCQRFFRKKRGKTMFGIFLFQTHSFCAEMELLSFAGVL